MHLPLPLIDQSRNRGVAALTFAVALVIASGAASAFQPLITDDTGTQGAGGNQFEASYLRSTDKQFDAMGLIHEVAGTFTRGLSDDLDVFIGQPRQKISPTNAVASSGWSNPALGAKWRFFEDDKLSFALRPELQLPVSRDQEARGLGTARASWRLDLLMTQETGFGALHVNLATTQVNYADDVLNAAARRFQIRWSVAPVWDLSEAWKLALDAGIMTNPDRAQKQRMGFVEIGTVFSPSKDLDFALGMVRNLSDGPVRAMQLSTGATWRFK